MSTTPIRVAAVWLIAILLTGALGFNSRSTAQQSIASQLLQIAEESLNVQYHTLVNGDVDAALAGRHFVGSYRESRMSRFLAEKKTRDELKDRKLDFEAFKTKLYFKSIELNVDKATLIATEYTELKMAWHPETTKLSDDHRFEFGFESGQWKLLSDSVISPSNRKTAATSISFISPTSSTLELYRSPGAQPRFHHHLSKTLRSVSPSGFYNAGAAAEYARAYALNRNPDYKNFNNDCANFVSQSLLAGGWLETMGVDRTNDANWFYGCVSPFISYSWGAAYNQWDFLRNYSGRGNELAVTATDQPLDEASLFEGDLVFCDWDPNGVPDGRVDHSIIVTTKYTSGDVLLSYHTQDTLNISLPLLFDRLRAQNRHVQFHPFKLKDSY